MANPGDVDIVRGYALDGELDIEFRIVNDAGERFCGGCGAELSAEKGGAATASAIVARASSLEARFGAKPPSSPTEVARPRPCRIFFRVWKISAP